MFNREPRLPKNNRKNNRGHGLSYGQVFFLVSRTSRDLNRGFVIVAKCNDSQYGNSIRLLQITCRPVGHPGELVQRPCHLTAPERGGKSICTQLYGWMSRPTPNALYSDNRHRLRKGTRPVRRTPPAMERRATAEKYRMLRVANE